MIYLVLVFGLATAAIADRARDTGIRTAAELWTAAVLLVALTQWGAW